MTFPRPRRLGALVCGAVLLGSAAATAFAVAPAPVKLVKRKLVKQARRCEILVSYPQVTGLPDRKVQAKINRMLSTEHPQGGVAKYIRTAAEGDDTANLEMEYEVTLNRKGLLSVRFIGLEMHTLNGQINEAHPTKVSSALTVDTVTGRRYSLRDLLKPGPDSIKALDTAICRALTRDDEVSQSWGKDPETFRGDVEAHRYRYFLTPKGIGIFNIYDNFAQGSIEVEVPFQEIQPVLKADGPLDRLAR